MSTAEIISSPPAVVGRRRVPGTLWVGLGIVLVCEALLFTDVRLRGGLVLRSHADYVALAAPTTPLGNAARWVAVNMTALAWAGYVLFLDGVLTLQVRGAGSPIRRRPHHFACLSLASIFIWCVFDWINFYYIRAWDYLGVPPGFWDKSWGYVLAFGAVVPGMLMSGQVLLNAGVFDRLRTRRLRVSQTPWRMPRWVMGVSVFVGVAMCLWPFVAQTPAVNWVLWVCLVLLLDPINYALGRPSMFRDFENGWYGRTLAAFAGGLICGLLWEFWNYWAVAKWAYHLPFLGRMEHVRYFEMPVPGLLGFLPFGLECWVMWQLMRVPLDGLAEPLPDERSLM